MVVEDEALPWATQPGANGWTVCGWCDRAIYRPALPCSERVLPGLLQMSTQQGQGERCKYEVTTRVDVAAA
jgi:hypothetical protein